MTMSITAKKNFQRFDRYEKSSSNDFIIKNSFDLFAQFSFALESPMSITLVLEKRK